MRFPSSSAHIAHAQQVEMEQIRKQLINQLKHIGITILDINLYDLSVHIIAWARNLEQDNKYRTLLRQR